MRASRISRAKIPGILLIPIIALVPIALVMAIPAFTPGGAGPGWDDEGEGGHTAFAQRLATRHEVRALEGSVALLPADAGDGDLLFLFPTYRPVTHAEAERLTGFVTQGGLLVIATGGGHGSNWTETLGVRFQGLPALAADPENETCLNAAVSIDDASHPICMQAPTSFPNTTHLMTQDEIEYDFIGRSNRNAFIDTNRDGRLSLGDQGPQRVPLVLQWSVGEGQIIAISDGTVWQNHVVSEHQENLETAAVIADKTDPDGAIYIDSTASSPRSQTNAVARPLYAGLSIPENQQWTALSVAALGLAGAAWLARRASPWKPHQAVSDAEDPELERRAREFLSGTVASPRDQDSTNGKQRASPSHENRGRSPPDRKGKHAIRDRSRQGSAGGPHGRR